MKRVLAMGNALVDILIRIENDEILEKLGLAKGSMTLVDNEKMNAVLQETKSAGRTRSTGGSAANLINGLARLGGVGAGYIGKVGDDEYGAFFNSDMVENRITASLFFGSKDTGKCVSLISKDSERTMATYLGAAVELDAGDLHIDLFKGYDYFHLEGYLVQNHDLVREAVKLARQAGSEISIDLPTFNVVKEDADFLHEIVRDYIDIFFANEEEARAFTGKADAHEALAEIAKTCKIAVVKLGANGSLIKSGSEQYTVSAIKADAVDTTGAGDLYAGGFFYGLTQGSALDICGRIGSISAGKIVEVVGAKMGDDRWQQVETLVNETLSTT